ncbi:hypothetical protein FOA52_009040 [Chlamydomonas sp. UWO 241]|nr:hypothetical protein FOA52_009040 [Chlamydomonas sp. UWO 241]
MQETAAIALGNLAADHAQNRTIIAAAGAIPALTRLLESESSPAAMRKAAYALKFLEDDLPSDADDEEQEEEEEEEDKKSGSSSSYR